MKYLRINYERAINLIGENIDLFAHGDSHLIQAGIYLYSPVIEKLRTVDSDDAILLLVQIENDVNDFINSEIVDQALSKYYLEMASQPILKSMIDDLYKVYYDYIGKKVIL